MYLSNLLTGLLGNDPLTDEENNHDINSVAGVLKLYFRGLENPLFPKERFNDLLSCISTYPRDELSLSLALFHSHTHTHTHTHTHIHTDRNTLNTHHYTHIHKYTYTQTDTQTNT